MNNDTILQFLENLSQNNSLDWMHQHPKEKKAALTDFYFLVGKLQQKIQQFDTTIPTTSPDKLTFRLNRDTRFSHDKSPYNPTFRAHIAKNGRHFIPVGYYLQLAPQGKDSFLGGGMFGSQFTQATDLIRSYLLTHSDEFLTILESPSFKKYFQLQGEQLKRFPRGYEETNTEIDPYIRYKSWYLQYDLSYELLLNQEELIKTAVAVFQAMKPFNDFLNRALIDFQFPKRG